MMWVWGVGVVCAEGLLMRGLRSEVLWSSESLSSKK